MTPRAHGSNELTQARSVASVKGDPVCPPRPVRSPVGWSLLEVEGKCMLMYLGEDRQMDQIPQEGSCWDLGWCWVCLVLLSSLLDRQPDEGCASLARRWGLWGQAPLGTYAALDESGSLSSRLLASPQ